MRYTRNKLTDEQLKRLYTSMLRPRMIEEKMLVLLRQGRVSKWFSGIGQEAISVGATCALEADEWIMPLHRNLGVFTARNISFEELFTQWQGHQQGFSKGRERSFHFGSAQHHICGMISHLGPQMAIADGVALAYQLRQEKKVSLAFTGDGGTSQGDFHEALNVAAVWGLPVIFIIENNGYGLSTPVKEQFLVEHLSTRAAGYGMKGLTIDGNNIIEVYDTIREARQYCIDEQKPILIECMTFRMRGHEEASGVKYVPQSLFKEWAKKDPIQNFENWLLKESVITEDWINAQRNIIQSEINDGIEAAFSQSAVVPCSEDEIRDVLAPHDAQVIKTKGPQTEKKFIQAISEALKQSMERYPQLVLMGQDIAEYGGAFKVTDGLMAQFGKARVRNTPLCESAIVGTALGLSLEGFKAMMEMQFGDFVTVGFNQIINNLAKLHYRWGQHADVVIRMPTGGGVGAGPFHSQCNEAWFTHTPGLIVLYPSSPSDAKGLLNAAIENPNPVLFFEHKALYRSIAEPVTDAYYTLEIGKAKVIQEGEDITIITYGAGVHWAKEFVASQNNFTTYILDLRSLQPLDYAAIREAVAATGKVLILHEDTLTGGLGGEISAWISEHCFAHLDAPVIRCASLDTPVPFSLALEENFLAKSRLSAAVNKLLKF